MARAVLLLVCALAAMAQDSVRREGPYWVQTLTGTVPAGSAAAVRIKAVGAVQLLGEPGQSLAWTVTKRVRAQSETAARRHFRAVQIRTAHAGGIVNLVLTAPEQSPLSIETRIVVPASLRRVQLATVGGNIVATGLGGALEATSTGGNIDADRIGGSLNAATAGGEVRIGTVGGAVRCSSGGGSIRTRKSGAETWLETAGGEIHVEESQGSVYARTNGGNIVVARSGGAVTAHTAGGRIEIQQALGLVSAANGAGSVEVGTARGAKVEAAGGAIRLRRASGALRAETDTGNIFAEILAGARLADSVLTSRQGDVTVVIPPDVGVTVRTLTPAGRPARVVSEFPAAEGSAALPGRPLNGGGPILTLTSSSGTIYLRRSR